MYTFRTRFAKDIVCEFLPPHRPTKKQRVIIFVDGAPSLPNKSDLMKFYSRKGFWTFHVHYRGSWESDGKFLAKSPEQDIFDVIKELPKGFQEFWANKRFKVVPDEIYVVGASFGGTAALLASLDKRVTKVIAIAPLVDWQKLGPDEPFPKLMRFFPQAYGNAYRLSKDGWKKLKSGNFFNPIKHALKIDGSKILIIHAKDDRSCPYGATKRFSQITNAKLITLPRGGHLGSSLLLKPRFYKIFTKFINAK